jgi:hypothetical protein
MKKQIFIFVLVIFATCIESVYGQAIHDSAPQATSGCTDDPLHPIAGKSYNYKAIVNPAGGNFTWWATKDMNFITNQTTNNSGTKMTVGAGLTATSASYGLTGATDNVDITWSSSTLAATSYQAAVAGKTPTFVVVLYDAPAAGCANNLKVYELDPKNGFIVDIKNIDSTTKTALAYGVNAEECIDKVSKATYVAGKMEYEYGTNIFYYELVAANFSDSWTPTYAITGLNGVQTSVVEFTYDKTLASGWAPLTSGSTVITTNAVDTSTGVSIYVRVTVTNNNYEGIAAENIVFALDGQNKEGIWDVVNATCVDPWAADQDDKATQVLKPRPAVTAGTTSTIPANTTLIPGNEAN